MTRTRHNIRVRLNQVIMFLELSYLSLYFITSLFIDSCILRGLLLPLLSEMSSTKGRRTNLRIPPELQTNKQEPKTSSVLSQ